MKARDGLSLVSINNTSQGLETEAQGCVRLWVTNSLLLL